MTSGASGWWRRAWPLCIVLVCSALYMQGCAIISRRGAAPPTAAEEPADSGLVNAEADSAAATNGPFDAFGAGQDTTALLPKAMPSDSLSTAIDVPFAKPDSLTPPPTASESAPRESQAPRAASQDSTAKGSMITVKLDEKESAKLIAATEKDLQVAQDAMASIDRENLSAEAAESFKALETLLSNARKAVEKNEVQAAAALAHKARLLAEELASQ